MSTTFMRGPLTGKLLDTLAEVGKPVGDMVIPVGGGWAGQPNAPGSTFMPYVVLSSLTASRSIGPFADSQADWQMPYMVQAFGVTREQCEWMADLARAALNDLRRQVLSLGEDTYTVQQVRVDSLGAVNRVAATDPAYFGQQDGLTFWLTKEKR